MIPSAIKYPGGDRYQAEWIISTFPEHTLYLEPCFGSGAVLFRKNSENVAEAIGDLYGHLTNFWRVLADEKLFPRMQRQLEATPFSEIEYADARKLLNRIQHQRVWQMEEGLRLEMACAFFLVCRQSLAGTAASFTPLTTTRLRRKMSEQASAWLSAIAGLPQVHARLRRVVILKPEPLWEVLPRYDKEGVLIYADPPFLTETRASRDLYVCEMSPEQHLLFLQEARKLQHAKIVIAGYPSELYSEQLTGWKCHTREWDNKSSMKKVKPMMLDCLWTNF